MCVTNDFTTGPLPISNVVCNNLKWLCFKVRKLKKSDTNRISKCDVIFSGNKSKFIDYKNRVILLFLLRR
jgi:hypothetical protein